MDQPVLTEEVLIIDELINAYVMHPGFYSYQEAYDIARQRDQDATEQFLSSIPG